MLALQEFNLSSVAKVLGLQFQGVDQNFTAVGTDTRSLKSGELFIALKGPNFDGHSYVQQAMEKGAVAAIVDHELDLPIAQLKVSDTHAALGQLATARRLAFKGKVVGLTGSNGKTTVKELIASILSLKGKILATQGNLNNDIGLPLTLLKLVIDETYAVIEMGANHPGEIAYLTQIARPDVALITNAGAAHLEGFGSIEGVANAKAEIYQGLTENGVAIINADDKYASLWLEKTNSHRQIRFGYQSANADVKASNIVTLPGVTEFELSLNGESIKVSLPLSGKHNVANALAAAAAASAVGVDIKTIRQGLETFHPVKGRLNLIRLASDALVIDDTYNANLDSMKAGIDVLVSYEGKKILVFGDLFEVGESSKQIHQEVGAYAKKQSVNELLAVGEMTRNAVVAFGENARHFESKSALIEYLKPKLAAGTVVLVKGSRGMRMEEVVAGIS